MTKPSSHLALPRSRRLWGALLGLILMVTPPTRANQLGALTITPDEGERAGSFVLSWDSTPGFVYRVQKSTDLGNNQNWFFGDAIIANSNVSQMEVQGGSSNAFYRLVAQPEIFGIEPTWVDSSDSSALLYLLGQCLPTNATVEINGMQFAVTIINTGGVWGAVSLNGLPPGELTGNVSVIDNATGNVVATYKLQSGFIYATQPPTPKLQEPPENPPASPTATEYYGLRSNLYPFTKNRVLQPGGSPSSEPGDHIFDSNQGWPDTGVHRVGGGVKRWRVPINSIAGRWQRAGIGHALVVKETSSHRGDGRKTVMDRDIVIDHLRVAPATGEVVGEETDLAIAGRGLDFLWTRTYRSRTGRDTAQGRGWDFSYNVSLTQQSDGTVQVCMGNGRCDTFYPNGTNGWSRDEYFVEVRDLDGDGMPDVLFADGGKWLFRPFDPTDAASGKLDRSVDRNGNTMRFEYNGAGGLIHVVDTLGRTNTIAYNTSGQIETVTDFSGRVVRYEYDSNGDLVACISPAVVGTPTGNDFAGGKTNRYTYSSGFSDEQLNHNLTSCIDGKGQISSRIFYNSSTDPVSVDFDAVAFILRGLDKKDIWRGRVTPSPANGFAVTRVIVNDYVGNVAELFYDSRQRCVRELEFTGRANAGLQTTPTLNRPVDKLRAEDPDFYETLWKWNDDSLCTQETLPGVGRTRWVYERDFNSSVSPRKKGDLRVLRELSCCLDMDSDDDGIPDATERVWRYEYDPRFGSPPLLGIVPSVSQLAINTGAGAGGGLHGKNPKPTQVMALDSDAVMRASGGVWPGTPAEMQCFVTSMTNPRGNTTTAEYDANGNCRKFRLPHLNYAAIEFALVHNSHGQLITITNAADANGYRRVDNFDYYTNGPQTGYCRTFTVDAQGPVVTITSLEYDERGNVTRIVDPRGHDWKFHNNSLNQCVRVESPTNITARCATGYFYDANDNLVQIKAELRDETDASLGNISTFFEYDQLDFPVRVTEQIDTTDNAVTEFAYDGNRQIVLVRSPEAVNGNDLHNVTQFLYDERGLLFQESSAPGSPIQCTTQYDYNADGNLTRVSEGLEGTPQVTMIEYDGFAGFGSSSSHVAGGVVAGFGEVEYGLMRAQGTTPLAGSIRTRLSKITDPMGNVTTFNYDANDNLKLVRHFGQANDVPGTNGNIRFAESRYTYDKLDRCIEIRDLFFNPTTQQPIGKGFSSTTFAYAPNGSLTSVTDDKGNATSYGYDTAARLSSITSAGAKTVFLAVRDAAGNVTRIKQTDQSDLGGPAQVFEEFFNYDSLNRCVANWDNVGNTNRCAYDSRGNLVIATDPRGNETCYKYDGLNRCTGSISYVGPCDAAGITINTTHVEYDSNSRCIATTDSNNNVTQHTYDSRDRCVSTTEADGTSCSLVWSPRSNLILRQDANGTVISNSFDLLDRCVRRDITPATGVATTTTVETFAHDGLSRLVMASNDVSRIEFAYDSMGNMTRTTQDGYDVLLIYDQNGNRTSMTYPSGRDVTYTYDALNQCSTVSTPLVDGAPPVLVATFSYEGKGRIGRIARTNGVNTRINWNGVVNPSNAGGDFGWGQISTINHQKAGGGAVIDRRGFAYDRNQNKTQRAQLAPFTLGGVTTTNIFEYDALDRLEHSAVLGGGGILQMTTYQLDGNGNRQQVISGGTPQLYTMDATLPEPADFQMNQYTTTPFGSQQYDQNGNSFWKDNGDLGFIYDSANRLVGAERMGSDGIAALVVSFTYDALGRRISKTTYPPAPFAPMTTQFIYGGDQDCDSIIEMRVDGALSQTFVHATGLVDQIRENDNSRGFYSLPEIGDEVLVGFDSVGAARYYHNDDLGNVLALTDAAGNVLERYDYDDFGAPQFLTAEGNIATGSDGLPIIASAFGNPFLFHGMEWDSETELYFEAGGKVRICHRQSARYFDPATGRPITSGARQMTVSEAKPMAPRMVGGGGPGNNPWTAMKKGTVKFFNEAKGFGIIKKEEGGRHTPFHNK